MTYWLITDQANKKTVCSDPDSLLDYLIRNPLFTYTVETVEVFTRPPTPETVTLTDLKEIKKFLPPVPLGRSGDTE